MSSETIKALLMITLFCGLLALLHLPQLINSQAVKRWRRATLLHRPNWFARAPIGHALIPMRVRRGRRFVPGSMLPHRPHPSPPRRDSLRA